MADRRAFLTGLVSLPLIGGGVTLIGRPAAAVPLVQAAALPSLDDPRQRARYAWEAFSAAMRELTADADGWRVEGVEMPAFGNVRNTVAIRRTEVVGHGGRLIWRTDHEEFEL